jgi:type IV pilus assembly protein PilE
MKSLAFVRKSAAGFTLMEMLTAVMIVGVLASFAVPSYLAQIRKARRTEARMALLDLAGREERLFSTTGAYSLTPADLGYGAQGALFPMKVGSEYYEVNVLVSAGPPATFTLTATPVAGHGQDHDAQCASFTVTQTGKQTALDSSNNVATTPCWG